MDDAGFGRIIHAKGVARTWEQWACKPIRSANRLIRYKLLAISFWQEKGEPRASSALVFEADKARLRAVAEAAGS